MTRSLRSLDLPGHEELQLAVPGCGVEGSRQCLMSDHQDREVPERSKVELRLRVLLVPRVVGYGCCPSAELHTQVVDLVSYEFTVPNPPRYNQSARVVVRLKA